MTKSVYICSPHNGSLPVQAKAGTPCIPPKVLRGFLFYFKRLFFKNNS